MITETIQLLGLKAKDRVTGYEGVITTTSFDLYGCVQVALTPAAKEGAEEIKFGHWFDVNRVEIKCEDRVMPVPDFDAKGTVPAKYDNGAAPKPPMGV
jgi:hypothetical protein